MLTVQKRTMMTIRPHEGVDAIVFGMPRGEIAQLFDEVPKRARRNQFSVADYDFFRERGFFVYYDAKDRCEAVEFVRGIARVKYEGYELFARPAREALAWARAQDQDLEDTGSGFVSRALGLAMYAPGVEADEEAATPAEGFMAFRPGYYKRKAGEDEAP